MSKIFLGVEWGATQNFYYIFALLVVFSILIFRFRRSIKATLAIASKKWFGLMIPGHSTVRAIIKTSLLAVGFVFLFIAFLRPRWDQKTEVIDQKGRDLFIALDVSRSMLAEDVKPNRLACAKEKIRRLVKLLKCERVGMILFSGSAFVQCPLTTDHSAFLMFLDQVCTETMSSGSTDLSKAITAALSAYQSTPSRKSKLVVLFTDGEDFSPYLSTVKEDASEQGLRVFTVGVGTEDGAPVPLFDSSGKRSGFQKDDRDEIVISRMNAGVLDNISQECGGVYVPMSENDSDVGTIAVAVEKFELENLEDVEVSKLEEQYPWFVGSAFLLFALEWLL